tara:strand:- start:324 stop:530 length:207 start_codon:yes stop_codon:yes gene_type:complete
MGQDKPNTLVAAVVLLAVTAGFCLEEGLYTRTAMAPQTDWQVMAELAVAEEAQGVRPALDGRAMVGTE